VESTVPIIQLGLWLAAVAIVAPPAVVQRPAIKAAEVSSYVGRVVTVEGTVAAVRTTAAGTVYLDLEREAPNQALSAVIYAAAAGRFVDLKGFVGKRVAITGRVARTTRGFEIILDRPAQLKSAPEPDRVPCGV
jgi:RecJ-like exonuclease